MLILTEKHFEAIRYILEGKNTSEVAKLCNVSRTAIYNWLSDKDFKAELEERRSMLKKSAKDKITSKVDSLTDEMLKLAMNSTDQRVKLQAIKYLLDRALGVPTASKEDENTSSNDDKSKDTNTLKAELEDIKNLTVIK